jgi:iron complex outermembrane receptor protein
VTASILVASGTAAGDEPVQSSNQEVTAPAEGTAGVPAPPEPGAADGISAAPAEGTAAATAPAAETPTVTPAAPQAKGEFDDLSLSQLLEVSVVASKRAESSADAPSSITVFTAEKIAALGLKNLNDVLQLVPGFDVRRSRQQLQLITVRGVTSDLNERLLIMIDGVRLGSVNDGGTGKMVRAINLTDVQRIEIIRGPGSALYGTNAFAAVVSIITKKGSDVEAVHVTGEAGSYSSRSTDVTAGKKFGDFNLNGHFGYMEDTGETYFIGQDGAGRSGLIGDPYKEFVGNVKVGYKDLLQLSVSGAHQKASQFITVGDVMGVGSYEQSTWLISSLDYQQALTKALKLNAQANFAYMDWGPITGLLWAPGMKAPFPDGMYAHPHSRDYREGLDAYVSYEPIKDLNLIAGVAEEYIVTYDGDRVSNGPDASALQAKPFYDNPDRYVLAAYAQGDYRIVKGLKFTAGVRYDHYNDFGGTTNPRVALVYNYRDKAWVKGLFATAFRAPSYRELHSTNGVIAGDPNNKAEKIMTGELVFGAAPIRQLTATVSLFMSSLTDMIYKSPTATPGLFLYQNRADLTALGVESEIKAELVPGLEVAANYTYVHSDNSAFGNSYATPMISRHAANFTITRDIYHHLRLSVLGEYRSAKTRYVLESDVKGTDPRDPVGEVFLIGAFAKVYDLIEGVAGYVRVTNAFNVRYLEPSTYPAKVAGVIPDDIHTRGIEAQVGLTYSFK